MPVPTGDQLKAARMTAGLSQAQAAELMGYPLQTGSRGGVQSRTWQALESTTDERSMQGPVFAMFLLLTGQHPELRLVPRADAVDVPNAGTQTTAPAALAVSGEVGEVGEAKATSTEPSPMRPPRPA